ncbi:MAG TPA: MFS transporter [Candidatus Limnocylindria bacterium]|nr:MFS transporter [Candidatus Limnocylindria bacterium]
MDSVITTRGVRAVRAEARDTQSSARRWIALGVVCFGALMIVLDGTIVNIALPSIQRDLGFSQAGLAWVVNAYVLTFGGFLLLGGRAADLIGRRAVLIAGLALFTAASAVCGLATTQWMLVAGRAVQGIGGAIVQAVALSVILDLFPETGERAKAMSVWGFVASAGGAVGVVLGGVLTQVANWHLVFLINLPIGVIAIAAARPLLPSIPGVGLRQGVDVGGALAITAAPILAVYGILSASESGWGSPQVILCMALAAVVLGAFVLVEQRVRAPIVPLHIFKSSAISISNLVMVCMMAAFFGWFFFSPLYMQRVLGFDALQTGLGFLPSMLVFGAMSSGIAAKLVGRFGPNRSLIGGISLATIGLALLARAPLAGSYALDLAPAMFLIAIGGGLGFLPLILIATGDARPQDSGLVSGLVSTSQMVGGAVGLAILATIAAARTFGVSGGVAADASALLDGYHAAFLVAASFAAGGVALATRLPSAVAQHP